MKRLAIVLSGLLLAATAAHAQEVPTLPFKADIGNQASLQRGARDFMAYCSGCHSLKYLRYNRMGQDLGISDELLKKNLILGAAKVGDPIATAMPAQSVDWFGRVPPDLSLETKAKGADWVYSYLMSFYLDGTRPLGVNNPYLPGVSMPAVLGELQGWQEMEAPAKGEGGEAAPHFKLVQPGTLSPEEYRDFVGDLTNFMVYASEPTAFERLGLGWKVLAYLFLLLILTYLLKKEFWRDIH
ncbi:MAG: cytochrome c1 [Nevskia sp.]|nr:cytochrome c1 [Nevskia sp.]